MKKTFFSFSFGCRVNQAEKKEIDKQLISLGFLQTDRNPSLFIINTCAVTHKAEREARQLIYQTRRKWPETKIVITGCAATYWIKQRIKIANVDYVFDNINKEYIAHLLAQKLRLNFNTRSNLNTKASRRQKLKMDKYLRSSRLLVKIQDGCHRFCTFCIVPYLRGQPKSKKIKDIISIIKKNETDIKEVILTAINTEAYGYDTAESFIDLIKQVLEKTKVERISFGSIHPWSITSGFTSLYKDVFSKRRLVDFFHIPLQSGSNKILNYMKRGYTREEILERVKEIEKINPLALISTDVIVGYLEEKDSDFQDTYNFLNNSPISKFHVFRFSKREQTAAYFMAKNLKEPSETVKKKRAKLLSDLEKRKYKSLMQRLIDKTFSTLFIDRKKDGFQQALLSNQVPVWVKTDKDLRGEIITVKVDKLKGAELFGSVIK